MESLYLTGICDLCDFFITTEQSKEPYPYHILILRVGAGKTNKNKVVFGRLVRHIDPTMYGFSALALYVLCRFNLTQEHLQMDFSDNEAWFNRKLLCAIPQKKDPKHSTSSLVIVRRRASMTRARDRTTQDALEIIPPSIPIQNIAMLPHNSVVTHFASVFQGVTIVLPHAPVFPIGETTFPMTQINLMNDVNTPPMV